MEAVYLFLIAAWVWFCLVMFPSIAMRFAVFVVPLVVAKVVLLTVGDLCTRADGLINKFIRFIDKAGSKKGGAA